METLFTHALGLSAPWSVTSVDFRQPDGAIHFAVECQATRLIVNENPVPGRPG